jgi:hypothetical protein
VLAQAQRRLLATPPWHQIAELLVKPRRPQDVLPRLLLLQSLAQTALLLPDKAGEKMQRLETRKLPQHNSSSDNSAATCKCVFLNIHAFVQA